MNKTIRKKTTGGKVVAAGGYGCVFNPALKCVDNKTRSANKVSKLMLKKYAFSEYNDVIKFKKDLEKIPNYTDFFLVDGFNLCSPSYLSTTDLEDYNKKCRTLKQDGITQNNINDNLNKLMSLNMPDGGLDLGDYLENHKSYDELIEINNSLIKLLLKGIIPMNKMGIYHCDVKESNILIKKSIKTKSREKLYARLIDWGLSTKLEKDNKIPKVMTSRPFQYNLPFSSILFNDLFDKMYGDFLKNNPKPEYYMIRTFVIDYIFVWNQERGPGHIKVIDNIFGKLFSMDIKFISPEDKKMIIEMEYTYNYIIDYLSEILLKYTKNGKFYLIEYFNNVYLNLVDIWGFIISYEPILTIFYSKYQSLTSSELKIFEKLKYIFLKYLYEPRTVKINITKLVGDLKSLNNLIDNSKKSTINLSTFEKQKPKSFSKNRKTQEKTRKTSKQSKKSKTSKNRHITKSEREEIAKTIESYLETSKKEERTASPSNNNNNKNNNNNVSINL